MHTFDVFYENADTDDEKQDPSSSHYYLEGLASFLDPQRGFYYCPCGWSGSELLYVSINYYPSSQPLPDGQGVCPKCHRPFEGCYYLEIV